MKKFRDWNTRLCLSFYDGLFGLGQDNEQDARQAFSDHPYAWLLLCIPIAGLAGFYGIVWETNLARRRAELEQRHPRP